MEDNNVDQPFNINRDELSTPSLRQIKKQYDIKKIVVIAGEVILLLLILIVIIIIASKDKNQKNDRKAIGEISCIFDTLKKTRILSDDFKKQDIQIYVDGKEIKYSKEYTFPNFGIHRVNFHIFSDFDMNYMFKNIPELLSVEMISNNNAKIISMIGAFEDAENLVNFKIEGFDTSQVKSMKNLFKGTKFKDLDTKGLDTKNVEDMSYMFSYMPNLEYIHVDNLDTSKVKKMSHLFAHNGALISANLRNFKTENVIDMSYMFAFDSSITLLGIDLLDTSNVEDMSYMFYQCTNIKK